MKDVLGFGRTLLIIGLLMKVFLGNDEQWEELLAEEARLDAAEAMNDTMTEVDGGVADGVLRRANDGV